MPRPSKLDFEKLAPIIRHCIAKKQSKVKIAEKLGVSRNTLHYWIVKYPDIRKLFDETKT